MNPFKTCKKCGENIYTTTFFVNKKRKDGYQYHERCLKSCGFRYNDDSDLVNNKEIYTRNRYTYTELLRISEQLLAEKDIAQIVKQIKHTN